MARPQPTILATAKDEWHNTLELCLAKCTYVVLYKGRPFGIRRTSASVDASFRKYLKTSYVNKASANNAVVRLNRLFNCQDFSFMAVGEQNEI